MGDLISRQAAIDVVRGWFEKIELNPDICIDGIVSLPSAQPEKKKGKWKRNEFGSWCEKCGRYAYLDKWDRVWESDFCPFCGADLREEE